MSNRITTNFYPEAASREHGVDPDELAVRSFRWQRWDVTIDNVITAENRFDVTEDLYLFIKNGPLTKHYRTIPLKNLVSVDGVHVDDGGVPLQTSNTGEPGTFEVTTADDELTITYHLIHPAQAEA